MTRPDSYYGRVCPNCNGRKSAGSDMCWRCAGHPEPRPPNPDAHVARTLNALWSAYPGRAGWEPRPAAVDADAVLLRWAAALPDQWLLSLRGFGRKSLTWLRAQPIQPVDPAHFAKSYRDGYAEGYQAGLAAAGRAITALSPQPTDPSTTLADALRAIRSDAPRTDPPGVA